MNAAQVHRGPDDSGVILEPALGAGLAVRRLSIVDIEHGRQPVANEDASIHAALNGEIYNHASLREELSSKGHKFSSRCDSEVIVHAYEEWGEDFLDRLHGMFALAVLDTRSGGLLLARDGPGMKPLYVAETPRGLVFASEVKAILATGWISPQADPEGIDIYLGMGFVPAPRTMFRGIRRLRAGCYVVATQNAVREGTFWQFRYENGAAPKSDEEHVDEFETVFRAAVRSHLAADVPVGALLSGGWDSSLTTAFAVREAGARMKTFSAVFPDSPEVDESRYARLVAQHLGSEHHEIEFRGDDLPALLPRICRHVEQPLTTAPAGVNYQIAALASRHVKTVAGGEGADELFGGYPWMRARWPYYLRRFVPQRIARAMLGRAWDSRIRRGLRVLAAPSAAAADLEWRRGFTPEQKREILRPEYQSGGPDTSPAWLEGSLLESCRDDTQRRLATEFTSRLMDGILHMEDKVSMAHSLEVRLPFLDRSVVAFAERLPSRMKIRNGREKVIVGRLAGRHLPREIAARRKQGLSYPPNLSMTAGFQKFARELLLDSGSGPFDRRRLEAAAERWQDTRGRLLRVAFLQVWWNEFLG